MSTLRQIIDLLDARGGADRIMSCPEPGCGERAEAHNIAAHLTNSHRWTARDVVILYRMARIDGGQP